MHEFVVPPPLEPGDRVAIVAPAGGHASQFPHVYEQGLETLRETFDLEPVEFPTATKSSEYLYDHPEERARDVEDAFVDPDIAGVIATIGGEDQIRILKHLDTDVLREHPTRFYGVSDNTNLQLALWNAGLVSYYGGMVMTDLAVHGGHPDYTERYLRRAFFEEEHGELEPATAFTDDGHDWADPDTLDYEPEWEDSDGWHWDGPETVVSGRTWGGCLEIVDLQLAVSHYLPDPDALSGTVLCLETSEELPRDFDVRWFLLGLGERGLLERFAAVLVGRARARSVFDPNPPDEREAYRTRQREAIIDTVREYNPDAPIVFDLEFGHTYPTAAPPIGGHVVVDSARERITFAE
ncbi:S66 peptidase family protein [Haladaptatus sp. YSMS36]|uniref:S66 family peptidase n=1 Tax=Haladaptatus sp. YSMS36 TaxID=3033384 RepID=UPI0023E7B841|nr:S66 peptidase family protein [Haladaptatus sp. YSMS36]